MEVTGSIDLQITGTLDDPAIRGALIVNSGELKYKVNRFQVDRGIVSFVNPARIDPEINLQLSSNIKDYQVMISLEGAISRLKTRFSSIPSLPTVDVVRLITTGELPSGYSYTAPEYRTADTTGLLSQMLSETVKQRLNRVIGVDTFSVDNVGVGTETASKTRVTVGEQVSRDLFVTYSKSFSSEEEDLIFIEYRLSPRVTVVASRDEKGYFGLDLRFRKKFR
jgi:translocation and assembly module TamB